MDSSVNDTITAVPGLRVGHWTDAGAATGCTVVLCPEGAVASADVRGGAPGTRETDLLRPGTLVEQAHGVLLSGGSAFGLDAAAGVMRWLAGRGQGPGGRGRPLRRYAGGAPHESPARALRRRAQQHDRRSRHKRRAHEVRLPPAGRHGPGRPRPHL